MKLWKALFGTLLLLLFAACTVTEEAETLEGPETQAENLSTELGPSPIAKMMADENGRRALKNIFGSGSAEKDDEGQSFVLIRNGADPVPCGGNEDYLVCAYEIEDGFYRSPIDVILIPESEEAYFTGKSRNFAVEIWDLNTDELILSNLCMDEREGYLYIFVRATYQEITDDPFYDFSYYTFVEPKTENIMQLNAVVENGVQDLNIDELTYECVEPTEQRTVFVTSLIKLNGEYIFKMTGLE